MRQLSAFRGKKCRFLRRFRIATPGDYIQKTSVPLAGFNLRVHTESAVRVTCALGRPADLRSIVFSRSYQATNQTVEVLTNRPPELNRVLFFIGPFCVPPAKLRTYLLRAQIVSKQGLPLAGAWKVLNF